MSGFKSGKQRYDERNHKSGKVITPETYEETDVVSPRGNIKAELYTPSEGVVDNKTPLPISMFTQLGEPFSLFVTRVVDPDLEIIVDTTIFDTSIQISCPTLPVVGQFVCLREGQHYYQGEILSVVADGGDNYTLGLDSPLDYAFTVLGGCSLTSADLNVNGSVAPVIFYISPEELLPGTVWDIHGVVAHIVDDATMDDTLFGGIASLTKGVVFRGVNGITKNFGNFKNNGDFGDYGFNPSYVDKAGGGQYAFRANLRIVDQYGTSLAMVSAEKAEDSDRLQVIIQDNLTAISFFHISIQGHISK